MTLRIEPERQTLSSAIITFTTSDDREFYALVSETGVEFFSDRDPGGTLLGKPISKSSDQILEWIKKEGDNKWFIDRKGLKPKAKGLKS